MAEQRLVPRIHLPWSLFQVTYFSVWMDMTPKEEQEEEAEEEEEDDDDA